MSEQKSLDFQVYTRKTGSSTARQLRRQQLVPAVVYGPGQKTMNLAVDLKTAQKYSKKEYENKIFTFKSQEKDLNNLRVLKKDISYHILTRQPQHIDFLSLDMNKAVRIQVEVLFTGKAKGVKESGGVLNIIRRQVEIECLPSDIPSSFSIDVSSLDMNQNFHVSDLNIPDNIKLITSKSSSLCAVVEIAEEEKAPAATAEATTTATKEETDKATPTDSKKPESDSSGSNKAKASK